MNATTRIHGMKQRALVACMAAICAASAPAAWAAAHGPSAAVLAVSRAPTDIVVTNCEDSGAGSLRDAANNAVTGDVIDLTQLDCSTISLTTGAILFGQHDIGLIGPGRNNLTIDGSGNSGYSVLYDLGGGTLHVEDLTITGGNKYRSGATAHGGCIYSEGNVDILNSTVTGCTAVANGGDALGGAVFASGEVYMLNSTVSHSHARSPGYSSGGGVYALGGFIGKYSTISDNYAYAVYTSPSFGGGLFARGSVFIQSCAAYGNSAVRMGGLALADHAGNVATIVNSTISGNTADEVGGVFAIPQLNIYNSTIAFNNSSIWSDGAGHYFAAGVYISTAGEMDSTIIANNVNSGGAPYATADLTGASGAGFNGGHNNVMFCGTACPTDTSHEDPGLGPLEDNGGPTLTHVPTPGQWDTFGGTNVLSLQWDQRGLGFPRQSAGDFPEIGALQINSDIIFVNGFN